MKLEAKSLPKGMLQFSKETQFQLQIGHSVVHLTDLSFTENEIELLNKDLPSPSSKGYVIREYFSTAIQFFKNQNHLYFWLNHGC